MAGGSAAKSPLMHSKASCLGLPNTTLVNGPERYDLSRSRSSRLGQAVEMVQRWLLPKGFTLLTLHGRGVYTSAVGGAGYSKNGQAKVKASKRGQS